MVQGDWNSFWASVNARAQAYHDNPTPYNTINYWTGGLLDTAVGLGKGIHERADAMFKNPSLYTVGNVATLGLVGQFNVAFSTPMSDPNYWRALRNILMTEAGSIAVYNSLANGIALPTTVEELKRWGDKFGIPAGTVPEGTLPEEAFVNEGASSAAEGFKPPEVYLNNKGQITNGKYIIDEAGMEPHKTGSSTSGKGQFLYGVDAETATLDAASYADANNLWVGNKAKVPVTNGMIGVTGKTGQLTNYINVYRTNTGFVHASPGNP